MPTIPPICNVATDWSGHGGFAAVQQVRIRAGRGTAPGGPGGPPRRFTDRTCHDGGRRAGRRAGVFARRIPPASGRRPHGAAGPARRRPGDLATLIERNRVPLCRDPAVQADLRAGALAAIRRARPGARGSPPRLAYLVAGLCWGELCKYLDVFAAGGDWSGRSGALSLRPLASVIGRPIHLHRHDRATGRWVRSGVIAPVFPDVEVAGDRPPIQLSVRDGGYQPRHAPTPTGPAGVGATVFDAVAGAIVLRGGAAGGGQLRHQVACYLGANQERLAHDATFQPLLLDALPPANQAKVTGRLLDEYLACVGRGGAWPHLRVGGGEHFSISP